jgi:hypothetical protein
MALMSKIDPEVLYLILTKVAAQQSLYNYDPEKLPTGQTNGTITHRQLSAVYERITGAQMSVRMNWNPHLQQLDALLARCALPSLAPLVLTSAEATMGVPADLKKIHAEKWPPFSALKSLYRRG